MNDPSMRSPLDSIEWPRELLAHVVTPGPHPCVHGYDLERDLAQHCGTLDLTFLALTGELPSGTQAAGVRVALLFLAPIALTEVPTHCAMLAALCGGPTCNAIAVGAAALAEQARCVVEEHRALFAWLRAAEPQFPEACSSDIPHHRQSIAAFESALEVRGLRFPALFRHRPTPLAAALSVLWLSGIEDERVLQALLVQARLPFVIAEALATKPLDFRNYAFDSPRFVYTDAPASAINSEEP